MWLYDAGSAAADFLLGCREIGLKVPDKIISNYCDVAFEGFYASDAVEACRSSRHNGASGDFYLLREAFGFAARHGRNAEMQQIGPMMLRMGSELLRKQPPYYELKRTLREMLRANQKLSELPQTTRQPEPVAVPAWSCSLRIHPSAL